MSEFRNFEMQRLGPPVADPDMLARAVRQHKTGDVLAQIAVMVVLMLAICAVTFVLSIDRAAAAMLETSEGTMLSSSLAAVLALAGLAGAMLLAATSRPRAVPVRIRAKRHNRQG